MSDRGQRAAPVDAEASTIEPKLSLGDTTVALTPLRLIGAIAITSAFHLVSSWLLLLLLTRAEVGSGPRLMLVLIVLSTGVIALLTARASARRGLSQLNRATPAVFGLVPPLASFAVSMAVLAGQGGSLETLVPLLAAATAPGVAIALTLEHALSALAARVGAIEALERRARGKPRSAEDPKPIPVPSLTGRLARLITGLTAATCLLALAKVSSSAGGVDWLLNPNAMLTLVATGSVIVTAILAAANAGSSPGRDVLALAKRLDAIGWDPESDEAPIASQPGLRRPLETPVRVTSFDATGELFANLERLRARLAREVGTYERALDETHAVDAAKREFLAAVSHELRTPLNSILGFAQFLLESQLSTAQAEDVRLILAGGRQLQELIEDILDLSMIESGELELRFSTCKIDELVEELVELHQAQVRERGTRLSADIRGPIPPLVCDRRRIGQVVTNLLSNAIKFTDEGEVTVSLRYDRRREQVAISVADTGVGIENAALGAIFEEYRQAGEAKQKIRGTGLGLAIARRIAEAHGGALGAESQLDIGSTFTLHLPLVPPDAEGADDG